MRKPSYKVRVNTFGALADYQDQGNGNWYVMNKLASEPSADDVEWAKKRFNTDDDAGAAQLWREELELQLARNTFTDVDPVPFEATYVASTYYRGRSAAGLVLHLKGNEEATANYMISEVVELLKHSDGGEITGWWQFVKRGQNYFVKFLGKEKPE